MKTVTRTFKICSFDELSDEAKEKVLDRFRHHLVDGNWWEWVFEDAYAAGVRIDIFDIRGLPQSDIAFTMGAMHTAQQFQSEYGPDTEMYKAAKDFIAGVMQARMEAGANDPDYYHCEVAFRHRLERKYGSILQQEYEYLTTDEAVIEHIEANEYEFLESGETYHSKESDVIKEEIIE